MAFRYKCKARNGEISEGVIDSATLDEARAQLLSEGKFPLELADVRGGGAKRSASRGSLFGSRITKSDILMVTCQLSVMTKAGIDLAEAIDGISENCGNPALEKVLKSMHEDVSSGHAISEAMRKHIHVFGESYVSTVAAAEASGTMSSTLTRLAELLRNEIRMRGSVISALVYPAALLVIAFLVMVVLTFLVLPQFAGVFRDLGSTPPPVTATLLWVADMLRSNVLIVMGVVAGLVAGVRYISRQPAVHRYLHQLELNGAVIQRAFRPLLLGQSFRLLATMLQSNVPLIESLELCRRSCRNLIYQELFSDLRGQVEVGQSISSLLVSRSFVPASAVQMVQTAERSGELGSILETIGLFYEEEGERELRRIVTMIEPIIVVVMGGIVAFVVASVMLPLLDVASTH